MIKNAIKAMTAKMAAKRRAGLSKFLIAYCCAVLFVSSGWSVSSVSVATNGVRWNLDVSGNRATLGWYQHSSAYARATASPIVGSLEIPPTLGDFFVTSISYMAFFNYKDMTSVTIPDSITSIGKSAFSDCFGLRSITMVDGITSIGDGAFSRCTNLTSITIPVSVTNVGNLAFQGCTGLSSVVIKGILQNTYKTKESPFYECVNLTNAVLRGAAAGMFSNSENLRRVTFLDGSTSIGDTAFSGCSKLSSVEDSSSSVKYVGTGAFSGCCELSFVELPNVNSIGDSAFSGCKGLKRIVVSDNLANIGNSAFYGCTNLSSVLLFNGGTPQVNTGGIGKEAFYGCRSLTNMVIPDGIRFIWDNAFNGCVSLVKMTIPNSVTSFSKYAFSGLESLVEVVIPQSICSSTLKNFFPYYYANLTNVVVNEGVTFIGTNCFMDCTSIRTVTIPASVTSIDNRAFLNCSALEKIVFLGNAPDVGTEVFFGTPRTLVVEVPRGSIGWNGGVSDELPDLWEGRTIVHAAEADEPVTDDGAGGYRVIDLSAGPDAVAYPVADLDAVPPGGWTDDYRTTKLVLRKIPAGTDVLGRYVLTEDFYCGVFEVTRGQYERVMGACPSGGTGDGRAVDRVSYDRLCGVDGFLARLRARTGLAGLDLPSEAQWEYACRAGMAGDYNNGGSSTNDLNALGRYRDNRHDGRGGSSGTGTTTVGSYAPNAWRLYDMHGNVWEWCRDWYGADGGLSGTNPVGAVTGVCRVVRGGGWSADADACRASSRAGVDPSTGGSGHGFRLVCAVDAPVADARVWLYEVNDDGTATVTGVDPAGGELEIPSEIDGRAVTAVGECAFMSCGDLVSVVVPPGVSAIGAYAFLCCDALVSVSLPDSVTNVMESAFEGCVALTSVELPAGVSSVGDYAFSGCTSLAEVVYGGFPPDDVGEGALPPNVSVRSAVTPTASITLGEDGLPVISWTPNLDGCVYTVLGKAALDDADWTPVTDANLAGMHFFKVVVEKATAGE